MFPRKSDGWDGFRDAVAFPAADADSGNPVPCAIGHAALTRHFGARSGDLTSLLLAFRRNRAVIERVASAKYDADGRGSQVLLWPEEIEALQGVVCLPMPHAKTA